jgi:DNA-binding response OmpR family regulator
MKIVLIEDEESLNIALTMFLNSEGYEVFSFSDLSTFFDKYKKIMPDLIISDVSLPDGNFLEEYKKHPELSYVKIMVISGNTEIENIKKAFNLGAEDFVKKPFDYEELSLRIKKIFKERNSLKPIKNEIFYDYDKKSVIRDKKEIQLTKKESQLLELLLENRGKVIQNNALIDYLWDEPVSLNTLNVLVKRLREKLGDKNIIKTKRDLGYLIE